MQQKLNVYSAVMRNCLTNILALTSQFSQFLLLCGTLVNKNLLYNEIFWKNIKIELYWERINLKF